MHEPLFCDTAARFLRSMLVLLCDQEHLGPGVSLSSFAAPTSYPDCTCFASEVPWHKAAAPRRDQAGCFTLLPAGDPRDRRFHSERADSARIAQHRHDSATKRIGRANPRSRLRPSQLTLRLSRSGSYSRCRLVVSALS